MIYFLNKIGPTARTNFASIFKISLYEIIKEILQTHLAANSWSL